MSDISKLLNLFLNAAIISFLAGAAVTLGCCLVCRAMKWAPVNITINNISGAANSEENEA